MSKNITPRWFNQKLETQREMNRIRALAMRQIAHVLKDEEKAVGATPPEADFQPAGRPGKGENIEMKKDWTWANGALKELGRLESKTLAIEDNYSKRISTLQAEELEKKKGLMTLRTSLKQELEKFVRAHRDELPGELRRIKTLPSGRVGLTLYTQIEIPDQERTIEALKRLGMEEHIKAVETINKIALQKLEAKDLKAIHVQRQDVERFFCEATNRG